jgi:hypothetical protein
MDQRQQHELEARLPVGACIGLEAAVSDGGIGEHGAEQGGDGVAVSFFPQAQQVRASELAPKLLANPRASETEAVAEQAHAFGNEGLRQEGGDLGRLDLEAVRRNATIAYAIPIRVKLPACWLLHYPPDAKRYTVPKRATNLPPSQGKHLSLAQRLSFQCSWTN